MVCLFVVMTSVSVIRISFSWLGWQLDVNTRVEAEQVLSDNIGQLEKIDINLENHCKNISCITITGLCNLDLL